MGIKSISSAKIKKEIPEEFKDLAKDFADKGFIKESVQEPRRGMKTVPNNLTAGQEFCFGSVAKDVGLERALQMTGASRVIGVCVSQQDTPDTARVVTQLSDTADDQVGHIGSSGIDESQPATFEQKDVHAVMGELVDMGFDFLEEHCDRFGRYG